MAVAEALTRTHDADGSPSGTVPNGSSPGGDLPSGSLPSVGALVAGRYRLTQLIGSGGMGTVYAAESVSTGRSCAVKLLGSGQAARSRSAARFEREARTLARLEHEHVIAVFDFGWVDEQTPFFVMEHLRGQTLRQLLEQSGLLAPQRAVELMKQACRGMAHAHAQGVVHRDLKPDNLMVTHYADGRPWLKILDFGIARQLESDQSHLTPTGADLGTPCYMSPEQARGETQVDARADVYALGAILYELLSGQRVHPGSSYNEILFQVITQSHVPLAQALPDCPLSLSALVERCLQKVAEERPAHAGELLSLLEQAQLEPLRQESSSPLPVPAAPALEQPRGAGRRASWWLVAAALAAGVTLGSLRKSAAPSAVAAAPSATSTAPLLTPSSASSVAAAAPASAAAPATPPPALPALSDTSTPPPSASPASRRPAERAERRAARGERVSSRARSERTPVAPPKADLPFATTNPYEQH